jgi:hypothetical protein
MNAFGGSGGPKYREHFHDFKAAVFGYALSGVGMAIIIHAIYLNTPGGRGMLNHAWANIFGAPH